MQVTTLMLSALSLASIASAQNGNDPVILNNRTGLAPAVYDGFTTSYTSTHAPVDHSVSAQLTAPPIHSNAVIKPTNSVQRWCNGGHRFQRHVVDFTHAAAGVARRVPPESFSTLPGDFNPGHTEVLGEPDDLMSILPIRTASLSGPVENLPIPTSLHGGEHDRTKQYDAPPHPIETGKSTVSSMPVSTSSPCDNVPPACEDDPDCYHILPVPWPTRHRTQTALPTSLWRGPHGTGRRFKWWDGPELTQFPRDSSNVQTHTLDPSEMSTILSTLASPTPPASEVRSTSIRSTSPHFTIPPHPTIIVEPPCALPTSLWRVPHGTGGRSKWWDGPELTQFTHQISAIHSHTLDCDFNYYPSGIPTVLPDPASPIPLPSEVQSTLTPSTSSQFAIPPHSTVIIEVPCTMAPKRKGPHVESARIVGVPIDWWRGPGQPVSPDASETVKRESSKIVSTNASAPSGLPSTNSTVILVSTDPCYRHYCPSTKGQTKPMSTTWKTITTTTYSVEKLVGPGNPVTTFPAVPPDVSAA